MRLMTGLRAFHYTAQCGGTTAAAQAMGVSQPTVSTQVNALEKHFGVELFLQVGRRLVPTEFSENLLVLTHRMFELEEEAVSMLGEARGLRRGNLRIGAVGPFNVMRMLACFRERYPEVFVTLSVGHSSQIVERVLNCNVDIGVLVHEVRDERVACIPFRRQSLVVFAHRDHPMVGRELRMADLQDQAMVVREPGSTTRAVFETALRKARIRVRNVMEIGSRESIREAVACGIGLGVVSDIAYVPDERLRPLRIVDFNAHSHAHLICLRERMRSRLIVSFLEVAKAAIEKMSATGAAPP